MPLEATLICLDNSEWMRNGDYTPTRMEAQHDAVNLIAGAKTQQNPESTVGLLSMAGKRPEILTTMTTDVGKVISSAYQASIEGITDILSAIQIAQLALKHRQNKNQHQRIILFVGSPVNADKKNLVNVGKRLRKNNIAVDIVNFGEHDFNTEILEAFVSAVNNNDNSHLVSIPPGPHILSDIILSSAVVQGEDGGPVGGSGGDANDEYGGIDPNIDPELAMVLRLSMEEERARQEASGGGEENKSEVKTEEGVSPMETETAKIEENDPMDDDDELQQALAMSMVAQSSESESNKSIEPVTVKEEPQIDDDELQQALAMSMAAEPMKVEETKKEDDDEVAMALKLSAQTQSAQGEEEKKEDVNEVLKDTDFLQSVLMTLPGVDPNDANIQNVLQSFQGDKPDEKTEETAKKDNEK